MPFENFRTIISTNWKAVGVAIIIILGGLASQTMFPLSWVITSLSGVVGLFVGMQIQRTKDVKTFSSSISSRAQLSGNVPFS